MRIEPYTEHLVAAAAQLLFILAETGHLLSVVLLMSYCPHRANYIHLLAFVRDSDSVNLVFHPSRCCPYLKRQGRVIG